MIEIKLKQLKTKKDVEKVLKLIRKGYILEYIEGCYPTEAYVIIYSIKGEKGYHIEEIKAISGFDSFNKDKRNKRDIINFLLNQNLFYEMKLKKGGKYEK